MELMLDNYGIIKGKIKYILKREDGVVVRLVYKNLWFVDCFCNKEYKSVYNAILNNYKNNEIVSITGSLDRFNNYFRILISEIKKSS